MLWMQNYGFWLMEEYDAVERIERVRMRMVRTEEELLTVTDRNSLTAISYRVMLANCRSHWYLISLRVVAWAAWI